jgi:hypothetical protein
MKKRLATMALFLGAALVGGLPGPVLAGSGNDAAIRAIQTLRTVNFLDIIDVSQDNPHIDSMRAMPSRTPLTPLQEAIAGNPALVEAIRHRGWAPFDLKSVYAARVEGYSVYLYMGDPPWN